MCILKALTYFLAFIGVFGNYFELSELIQRIQKDSDSTTIYFIGIDSEFLTGFMRDNVDSPAAIFTSPPSDYNERLYENAGILVIETLCENHQCFAKLETFIRQLRVRKFVIISANNISSLQEYFSYFWENKFIRIFGIAAEMSYAYLPYAEYPVQSIHTSEPLPDALRDMNGFTLRTTVQTDFPRNCWYPDKNGKLQVGGSLGQVFLNFVRKHNATFKDVIINNSSELFIPGIINATISNEIDISSNGFTNQKGLDASYPIKIVKLVVVMPLNGYVDPNEYFLRPFSLTAWLCVGLTLVYIVLMDVLMESYVQSTVDVWHSFSRTFLSLLQSPLDREISTPYRFHVQVLLFAFVLGNFYGIYFTSFLTVFIKVKQYETLQDLIDNNVRVMYPYFTWSLISNPELHPAGFEKIVTLVDYPTFYTARDSMNNTDFSYPMYADTAEFLVGMQTHLGKPLFHITRDGIKNLHICFLLAKHSPFKEILSDFVIHIMETGLIKKWDYDAIAQAQKMGFSVYAGHDRDPKLAALTLNHLRFAWNCLSIGLTVASTVFLCERFGCTVKRFLRFRKNYFKRRSREEGFVYLP